MPTVAVTPQTNDSDLELQETISKLAKFAPIGKGDTIKTGLQEWADKLPEPTKKRFAKYGIDISKGYPGVPDAKDIPTFVDEAFAIRNQEFPYIERGKNADPEKKAL